MLVGFFKQTFIPKELLKLFSLDRVHVSSVCALLRLCDPKLASGFLEMVT